MSQSHISSKVESHIGPDVRPPLKLYRLQHKDEIMAMDKALRYAEAALHDLRLIFSQRVITGQAEYDGIVKCLSACMDSLDEAVQRGRE